MRTVEWVGLETIDPKMVIQEAPDAIVWRTCCADCDRAVAKVYRRRSAWAAVRGWLGRYRVAREHRNLGILASRQVPTSLPVAWARGRSRTFGRYELLVTREIVGATSLKQIISAGGRIDWDLTSLFQAIRQMHERGVLHGWLHLGNLLTRGAGDARAYFFIDVPTAVVFPRSIVGSSIARYEISKVSDLLIRQAGLTAEGLCRAACGEDDEERRRFLGDLEGYGRSRMRRRRMWLASRVWWAVSWAAWYMWGRLSVIENESARPHLS